MNHHTWVRVGAAFAAATLVLTACGNRGSGGGGDDEGDKKVAKIGVIAPLSGDLAALGLGIRNSVDLAIKQANEDNAIPGWELKLAAEDDEAKPDVGKNAATKLANDKDVVAVVGTLNSSTGQQVQPVLDSANIAQVSPANTGAELTKGADFRNNPKRPYDNYFRVCTNDAIQGPFAARYVYNELKHRKIATIHDKKTYGQGLVGTFTEEYEKLGGEVVSAQTINPEEKNYSAVISKIKPRNPQLIYYGGEYPQAGPLKQQLASAGVKADMMGADGTYSEDFISLAGKAADGYYATSIGAPLNKLPAAKQYVKDYDDAGYKGDNSSYGAYAYDSTTAIINALKVSLKDADTIEAAREPTIEQLGKVSFDGLSGKVAFDKYGDTTNRVVTVYQVDGDAWTDVNTEEFK